MRRRCWHRGGGGGTEGGTPIPWPTQSDIGTTPTSAGEIIIRRLEYKYSHRKCEEDEETDERK